MTRRALGLIAGFLLVAAAIYATDPWKDKNPENWDAKDVQEILQDSPWSRKVQFGMSGSDAMAAPATSAGNSSLGPPNLGRDSSGTEIAGTTVNAPNASPGARMDFTISWISSRTIREAQARRRELGGISPEIARKDLAITPDAYEIMVAGSDMSSLARQPEAQLIAHAYLMLKASKTKITPSRIRVQKDQIGAPVAIVFVFDKKTANGDPLFPSSEKGVEFATALGKTPLKANFDFSKMRDKLGLDL